MLHPDSEEYVCHIEEHIGSKFQFLAASGPIKEQGVDEFAFTLHFLDQRYIISITSHQNGHVIVIPKGVDEKIACNHDVHTFRLPALLLPKDHGFKADLPEGSLAVRDHRIIALNRCVV